MTSLMADGGGGGGGSGMENDNGDDIFLDMDSLMEMLNSDNPQMDGEDLMSPGSGGDAGGNLGFQSGFQMPANAHERDASDFGTWDLGSSFNASDHGQQCSQFHGYCGTEGVGALQSQTHHCSSQSSFDEGSLGIPSNPANYLTFSALLGKNVNQFRQDGGTINSENMCAFNGSSIGNLDMSFKHSGSLTGKASVTSGSHNETLLVADAAVSSRDPIESTIYGNSDVLGSLGECDASIQSGINVVSYLQPNFPSNHFCDFNFEGLYDNGSVRCNQEDEVKEFHTNSASSGSDISAVDESEVKGFHFKFEGGSDGTSLIPGHMASCFTHPGINKEQYFYAEDNNLLDGSQHFYAEDNDLLDGSQNTMIWHFNELGSGAVISAGEGSKNLPFGTSASMPSQMHVLDTEEKKVNTHEYLESRLENGGVACRIPLNHGYSSSMVKQYLPFNPSKQSVIVKDEGVQSKVFGSYLSRVSPESIQSNSSSSKSHVDDDTDVCILEDISQPARQQCSLAVDKTIVPHRAAYSDSQYSGAGSVTFRPTDERFVFRVALQDLSQPKSEATPPDGVLAIPLLRHQRIALSWMVQKETSSLYCSGGILADDQGLGKTISTIALILKERPPALRVDTQLIKKEEFETLDLDDDDDVTEVSRKKQNVDFCTVDEKSEKHENCFVKSKGRPAAGTLVVCPTSVLRQWADELHKKVTKEANLSVLVYHGSNRTKDSCDLAKYDVVLTTYAIVSMEVPKQPLVDEDSDEKAKVDFEGSRFRGLSSEKKRKYPPSSGKNGSKSKRGIDKALFESLARPLAKVAWFRVVLDEAQSIKNHRTQVARACWGLRAKRRWCLSGTPIQNAIDDLYSYFRFLRYDPYAVYKSFCSTIKVPIQKSPTKGYKKLQAVLKTIMLRRTKGTLIDGEPIITLPPKVVELKKVDFTEEERDFYTRLEADSRAQFKEYADAGTVKQNYVNILLMLLRLRQACDHPLLVRGPDSDSLGKKSVEMAKKLSRDQQVHLLNFLEASLAICGICNDPPEDAVVSVCGHVFCNQCISEHLSGDDNQCPSSNCKVRLSLSSVFCKATLNSSLQGQPAGGPHSEHFESFKPNPVGFPLDSSKIRAALDVLKSLAIPKDHTSDGSLENSSTMNASCPIRLPGNPLDANNEKVDYERKSNHSAKVVGEKAIVFSQWTRMLDLLETCLKNSSIQYRRLDGTMSVLARDKAVKDFNTIPEISVMIMSLKAASLGLNMVAACRVLLLDLWWNPTTEDQAIDRAHRIGQTRPVNVLRLTVRDTVEDRILALQQKKREMVASAFGEDESGSRQSRLTVEDLKYLFMV